MDVSEVLFNELAFFKMMEDCRGYARSSVVCVCVSWLALMKNLV